MTAFNVEAYGELLKEILPQVIQTEQEYDRVLPVVERLHFKKDKTPEETTIYNLLVQLVVAYETENFPMESNGATRTVESKPHEILHHIMDSSGTTAQDLVGVIATSMSEVVDILSGKIAITEEIAINLGERFSISPKVFL